METKPCVKCGSTERYKPKPGKKIGDCKACQKARNKAWHKANSEKNRARNKDWKQANPEKCRAHSKTWRKANPEKNRAIYKAWLQANPEKKHFVYAVNKLGYKAIQTYYSAE